jgi:hypothetical protein
MAPITQPTIGAQQLVANSLPIRQIGVDVISKLPDPSTHRFTPVNYPSYLPRKLLIGATATSFTWAALVVVGDATEVIYFQEDTRSNTVAWLSVQLNGPGQVLRAANLFPFVVFGRSVEGGAPWKLALAGKSLGLFVQHEFLRCGEPGKVLSDEVVRDDRHFVAVWETLAEGCKSTMREDG